MAAEPGTAARRPGERTLVVVLAVLAVALVVLLVASWLAVRQPPTTPLPVPSVSQG